MKYKPTALKTMQKYNKDFKRNLSTILNKTKSLQYKETEGDRKRDDAIRLWNEENDIDWKPLFMRGKANSTVNI